MMTVGSLFSGIGGIDLGFQRAGFEIAFQVEIDPFCRRVLAKHWPGVRRHDDVRTFPPGGPDEWQCDVLAGGFPCQDISHAGKMAGITGERSGLWGEYARVIGVLRPRYVFVENVSALLCRGLGRVLGDLATLGYDAEWDCVPAGSVGAPHLRDRFFLVAYPDRQHGGARRPGRPVGIAAGLSLPEPPLQGSPEGGIGGRGYWATEPRLARLVHGVPPSVDRIRGLGNVVVPQVAEWIASRIRAVEQEAPNEPA